jgi:hypothetical protein
VADGNRTAIDIDLLVSQPISLFTAQAWAAANASVDFQQIQVLACARAGQRLVDAGTGPCP